MRNFSLIGGRAFSPLWRVLSDRSTFRFNNGKLLAQEVTLPVDRHLYLRSLCIATILQLGRVSKSKYQNVSHEHNNEWNRSTSDRAAPIQITLQQEQLGRSSYTAFSLWFRWLGIRSSQSWSTRRKP